MPSFLATRSVILILVVHDRLVSFLTRLLHSLAHYLLARVNDICVCDTKLGLWNCLITALSSVAGSPCRPRLFDPGWHCFIFSCVLKSRTATWATPTYQPCFIAKATYVWWVVTLLFFSTGPVNVILWTKPACSALRRPLLSTGPLSDLRYRQVRLDWWSTLRMRARQAPLTPATADCHLDYFPACMPPSPNWIWVALWVRNVGWHQPDGCQHRAYTGPIMTHYTMFIISIQ